MIYPVFGEKVVSKVSLSPLAIWEKQRNEDDITKNKVMSPNVGLD